MSARTKEIILEKDFFENIDNNDHIKLISAIIVLYFSLLICLYFVVNILFQNETPAQYNYDSSTFKVLTSYEKINYDFNPIKNITNYNILLDNKDNNSIFIASKEEKERILNSIKKKKEESELAKIRERENEEYTVKGFSIITAYSSDIYQCDSTPCITANGFNVCEYGIMDTVAANHLKFGTKIKIPDVFGDRIFIVRDRMNNRYKDRVDIWMTKKDDAINFGVKEAAVYVKNN